MPGLVDIILGYDCNLFCDYCTITPQMRLRALSAGRVARSLRDAQARGYDRVQFTGGEPTIRGDLLALCRHARSLGFRDIKVQTNGLLLAPPGNLARLREAGVTTVHVSIHTHQREAYERMVRRTGVYDALVTALRGLVASDLTVGADVILTTETYARLPDAIAWLADIGIASADLWFVSLTDQNASNPESMPRMSEVIPSIRAAVRVAETRAVAVRSLHIPRCLLEELHPIAWDPGAQRVRVVSPDATFELAQSPLTPQVQVAACSSCRFQPECPGLRRDYLAHYGEDEIRAVAPE